MRIASRWRALTPPPSSLLRSEDEQSSTIKLGLGDFVFYSVLSGRAALNGFSTLMAVVLSILMGLASTLLLLAVYRHALPALPISICIGVIFYFVTTETVVPMLDTLIDRPLYI